MASENLQEREEHRNVEAFPQGNFFKDELLKRDVFVKRIKKSSNEQTTYLTEKELQELHHQHIIQIFSYEAVDDYFRIKTECCDFDLDQYLTPPNCFDRRQEAKMDILQQIGKGLKYLHNHNKQITHGNLRPQNVLMKQSTNKMTLTVRLTDFYCPGVFDVTNPTKSLYRYCISPEVLEDVNNVTTAVDIYAYGCLIHTVLTDSFYESYHPFGKLDDKNFLINVAEGKRINKLSEAGNESDFFILADLAIDDATDISSMKRPRIATLLKHPVFWTEKHKEVFFMDIVENYIKDNDEEYDFLQKFETKMETSLDKNDWKKIYPRCYNLTSYLDDGEYKTLVIFIRDKCAHFAEDKAKFKQKSTERLKLGENITEFIGKICKFFPYVIFNLFTCYREYVTNYVTKIKENIPENCLSYFDNLSKDIINRLAKPIGETKDIGKTALHNLEVKSK